MTPDPAITEIKAALAATFRRMDARFDHLFRRLDPLAGEASAGGPPRVAAAVPRELRCVSDYSPL